MAENKTYHQERPHGIVQEHNGGGHEHGEADESVKLSFELAKKMIVSSREAAPQKWMREGCD